MKQGGDTVVRIALAALLFAAATACDRPAPVDPLSLSDAGIGAVSEDTPFILEVIADLFPDFLIEPGAAMTEGHAYPVIRVIEGDQELFSLHPGWDNLTIARAEVSSPFVVLASGAAIGDTFAALLPQETVPDIGPPLCARGLEELSPFAICRATGYAHVYYVFAGDWDGPDDLLPPRRVLDNWTLAQFFWVP
ncbi:MAG: DUF1131 family protein [Alphaproteobacteria bacterium]|nr:DUF1131 family protein [Alphaproteobacteria bacterium]